MNKDGACETIEVRPVMVTLHVASEKTGLPYAALLRMVHEGRLPYIASGRKFYINYTLLCRLLNGEEV